MERATSGKSRMHRQPPRDAILDPEYLRDRLDLSEKHLTGFYQALHQQNYPSDMHEFLSVFHKIDDDDLDRSIIGQSTADPAETTAADEAAIVAMDTGKNTSRSSTYKKGRNKIQLPKRFLEFLRSYYCSNDNNDDIASVKKKKNSILSSRVHSVHHSANTLTTKLVIELHDGLLVESVIMRYDKKTKIPRASLCVSSQVGCAMQCTFCATGTMGKIGNLGMAEILEQVIHANQMLQNEVGKPSVRNVVFMGMGEPLDNYNNVVSACKALIDKRRWNLAHGRVTVSTVGIVSKIRQLSTDLPEVSLALSLHAPNQQLRESIVPTAHRYPITELIDALDNHMRCYDIEKTKRGSKSSNLRKAMIEYVLLEGPTSTLEAAHELGRLCQNRKFVVNLIPYNSTDAAMKCPPLEQMRAFRTIVVSYGVFCTIRRTMGADIDSACGQLVKKQQQQQQPNATTDIEDVVPNVKHKINNRKPNSTNNVRTGATATLTPTLQQKKKHQPIDLGDYVEVLAVATALAACSFIVSLTWLLRKARGFGYNNMSNDDEPCNIDPSVAVLLLDLPDTASINELKTRMGMIRLSQARIHGNASYAATILQHAFAESKQSQQVHGLLDEKLSVLQRRVAQMSNDNENDVVDGPHQNSRGKLSGTTVAKPEAGAAHDVNETPSDIEADTPKPVVPEEILVQCILSQISSIQDDRKLLKEQENRLRDRLKVLETLVEKRVPNSSELREAIAASRDYALPSSSIECVVCHNRSAQRAIIPCGHLCLCDTCTQTLVTSCSTLQYCPLCRGSLLSTLRIYIPK